MPKSDYKNGHVEAQMTYHQRRMAAGMFRAALYVPRDKKAEFWKAVNKLRDQWAEEGYDV